MSGRASADMFAGVRDGSAWDGDANARIAALDALVARQIPLGQWDTGQRWRGRLIPGWGHAPTSRVKRTQRSALD
jgi:hypothetical protein